MIHPSPLSTRGALSPLTKAIVAPSSTQHGGLPRATMSSSSDSRRTLQSTGDRLPTRLACGDDWQCILSLALACSPQARSTDLARPRPTRPRSRLRALSFVPPPNPRASYLNALGPLDLALRRDSSAKSESAGRQCYHMRRVSRRVALTSTSFK